MRTLIFLSVLLASCNHGVPFFAEWVEPEPIDTIEVEPIIIDTCEGLQSFSNPFITGRVKFDVAPDTLAWFTWAGHPTTLDAWFSDYEIFQNGKALAIIANGTNDAYYYNLSKIRVRDGNGVKNIVSFSERSLSMGGAATYEEMKYLQTKYKSRLWLNYLGITHNGLALDSLQNDTLISYQVDSFCLHGGKRIDLRKTKAATSRADQCDEVGWDQVITD